VINFLTQNYGTPEVGKMISVGVEHDLYHVFKKKSQERGIMRLLAVS